MSHRRWDLDAARGLAVLAMVAYHLCWDLSQAGLLVADFTEGPWQWSGRVIGATFILLMGVSLVLHWRRAESATGAPPPWRHHLVRAALLLAGGSIITAATWATVGPGYVRFGILHLLGVSLVLARPLLTRPAAMQLMLGVAALALGAWLFEQPAQSRYWVWLGVRTYGASMVDWYPLFPWAGFALIGTGLATWASRSGWSLPLHPVLAASRPGRALAFLGRHSLVIYLAHQPVLLGLFTAAGLL